MMGLNKWTGQLIWFVAGMFIFLQVSLVMDVYRLKQSINDHAAYLQALKDTTMQMGEVIQAKEVAEAEEYRQQAAAAEREANLARDKAATGDNAGTSYFEPLTAPPSK